MFDIGWSELLVIGLVALIVVGPKDLPHLFHSLGRFTARARSMAREFSSAMEDAARQSGMDDAKNVLKDVKNLTSKKSLGLDALDRAADKFEKWEPKVPTAQVVKDPADPVPDPTPAPVSEPTSGAEPATPPQSLPAGGQRQIKAVRRSDLKED